MHNKLLINFIMVVLFFVIFATPSHAWFIYHKPEFKGKVIDAETKEPIEGAVVVAVYNKRTMGLGAGALSSVINVREALTDKEGNFNIPSYTTLIQPFSWTMQTSFIIFKPGYASIPDWNMEECLSGGVCIEVELPWFYNQQIKYRISPGVVELPKLKTKEERLKAKPSPVEDSEHRPSWYRKQQKQFIQLINEERKNLGLTGGYNIEEED